VRRVGLARARAVTAKRGATDVGQEASCAAIAELPRWRQAASTGGGRRWTAAAEGEAVTSTRRRGGVEKARRNAEVRFGEGRGLRTVGRVTETAERPEKGPVANRRGVRGNERIVGHSGKPQRGRVSSCFKTKTTWHWEAACRRPCGRVGKACWACPAAWK